MQTHRAHGLAPGTLTVGRDAQDLRLRLFRYGSDHVEERELASVDELETALAEARALSSQESTQNPDPSTIWVDVSGLGDAARLARLGEVLDLHVLVLEDVATANQRPKVETFGEDLLFFARMPAPVAAARGALDTEQLALLLRSGMVITFQERAGDCFEPVRQRLHAGNPRIRSLGADYLAYALIDALVDIYVLLLDVLYERIETVDDLVLEDERQVEIEDLHLLRRDLVHAGRFTAPLRAAISELLRPPNDEAFGSETRLFLRDCLDHAMRTEDRVASYRELVTAVMDLYLTILGHRSNEVMKVLTIIGSIFIPLSFLAGLYGMNFDTTSPFNLPELSWRYGYFALLGLMATVATTLVVYFKKQRWF